MDVGHDPIRVKDVHKDHVVDPFLYKIDSALYNGNRRCIIQPILDDADVVGCKVP